MAKEINIQVYDPHLRERAKTWSIMRSKNLSGGGQIFPTRLTWERPIIGTAVSSHIVSHIKEEPFKGYRHFLVSPVEEKAT
ncbi:hypothetical protein DB346_02810 [Verrucomicrobia bacterium LW23]|nr:hypothetical protein DB346_03845 [Verrucomicrobia bacterium LW23]PTY04379.1 hypothetical protein DB346_02810 [Verrucomicrobia bacterium LW23]